MGLALCCYDKEQIPSETDGLCCSDPPLQLPAPVLISAALNHINLGGGEWGSQPITMGTEESLVSWVTRQTQEVSILWMPQAGTNGVLPETLSDR